MPRSYGSASLPLVPGAPAGAKLGTLLASKDRKVRRAAARLMRAKASRASDQEVSAMTSEAETLEGQEAPNNGAPTVNGAPALARRSDGLVVGPPARAVLSSSDIEPRRRRALFELAIRALEHELRATRRVPVMAPNGSVKGHRETPDWAARNRAADRVFELLGSYGSKGDARTPVAVQVNVTVPEWAQPRPAIGQVVELAGVPGL